MATRKSRAGGRSSRRDNAGSGKRGAVAEEEAPKRDSSRRSGRADKSSRKSSKKSGRDKARGGGGSSRKEAAQPGRRRQPRKSGKMGTIIAGLIVIVLLGAAIFALMYPGMQREAMLTRLDEAQSLEESQKVVDEFLTLIEQETNKKSLVSVAIVTQRGSVDAQIYMAVAATTAWNTKTKGNVNMIVDLINIVNRPDNAVTDQQRSKALQEAVNLLRSGSAIQDDLPVVTPSRLLEWIEQKERDERNRDLSIAAINFVGQTRQEIDGSDPGKTLAGVVRDTTADPKIIDAAITNLGYVLNSQNLGFGLSLITSSNGDKVIANDVLMRSLENNVRPRHITTLFDFLDNPSNIVQAAGATLLKGPGLKSVDEAQREEVSSRLSSYISVDTRKEKPEVFSRALESAATLQLYGVRTAALRMMAQIPADHPDAELLADCLGRAFIGKKEDEAKKRSEEIIAGLAKGIDNEAARQTAAKALMKIKEGGYTHLRTALKALIANGTDADCFAAAKHIVEQCYARKDVTDALGDDLNAWVEYLAKDEPRFKHYLDTENWYWDNAEFIRATDDQELLRQNRTRVIAEIAEFDKWDVLPLGIEVSDFEEFKRILGVYNQAVNKAIR